MLKYMYIRSLENRFLETEYEGPTTRLRNSKKMLTPNFKCAQTQKSVVYTGSVLWNNRDKSLKNVNDKKLFNIIVKKKLIEQINTYVD